MPHLSISLLGPKLILLDGKPAGAFTYNKALALLAYLAVEAGFPHSRQEIVGLLWPDLPNAAALANLRQVLLDLRRVLGEAAASPPFLFITRENIQFNADSDCELDVTSFLRLLTNCETHRHRHIDRCRVCHQRLEAAIALYRGVFLSGFSIEEAAPFDDWSVRWRERLHLRAQHALAHLVNYLLRGQDDAKALFYLRRQLELEPWNEEAHQQLMRLYVRNGQRSNALLQFETCQRILSTELGVEPAMPTQTLHAQIRAEMPLTEEPHSKEGRYWQKLPVAVTPLIGRNQEREQLGELLADPTHRLISIVGPGGIGKTRLALAVAADHVRAFGNGVVFVSLAGLSDVHFVPNAIIAELDAPMPDRATPQEQLFGFLRDRELLLVLDNYEQFLPDVAFLTHLLRAASGVTILVTSRERLAMQPEHLYELAGLDYPCTTATEVAHAALDQYPALQLFVQRARQVRRGFSATTGDLAAILRIARVTEGMPLALELAGAAIRTYSCAAIADALESGRQTASPQLRDLPERQRSMQAVFKHSMRLLSSEEYRAFCSLGLFRGGFSAEAAQEVAQVTAEVPAALVDKSLVRVTSNYRYDLHELMRQFAEQELGAGDAVTEVRTRYASYFMQMAREAEAGLVGVQPGSWIARLELEIDNLRAVMEWLRREGPQDALCMALELFWFWHARSYLQEGLDWYVSLSAPDVPVSPFLRADTLHAASYFALCLDKAELGQAYISQSLEIYQTLDRSEWNIAQGYVAALTGQATVLCNGPQKLDTFLREG